VSTPEDFGIPGEAELDLPAEHARRLAAVLDSPARPVTGEPLPLLWHWAFGTPDVPTSALGPDGHPRLPPGGPAEGLPRRMWAGGHVATRMPLVIGTRVLRRTSVLTAERKTGRSGEMLVVTFRHTYLQHGRIAITERQDVMYLAPGRPLPQPVGDHAEQPPPGGWADRISPGPVLLFRFSAVTFNAHRIHYDPGYAGAVEGYPGLVVHGPLTAMLLNESVRRHADREPEEFSFRATAPLFAGLPCTLTGEPKGPEIELTAVRNDGRAAMRATARIADRRISRTCHDS
jgi:3-methylfumaryl-CoA hydratase